MKKIFLWGAMALLGMGAQAQTPPIAEIRTAAGNYMKVMCPQTKLSEKAMYKNAMTLGDTRLNANPMSYLIEYSQGGWILMSNDYNVQPVLAYSPTGLWNPDTSQMSPALAELLMDYVCQIDTIKMATQGKSAAALEPYAENRAKWEGLRSLNSAYMRDLIAKKAGTPVVDDLLRNSSGDEVKWGQSKNKSGGTSPKYNKFAPSGLNYASCKGTERKPIGCASVAMGQLMWYWQFPPQYDWDKMPVYLSNGSTVQEENNIAHLLKDCADASGILFTCLGSWTTTNKVVDALKDMHFPGVSKVTRRDRDVNSKFWLDILKGQLDNGWPVFYRGDKCDLCTDKHFWVISGYNVEDAFYCNWGWSGNSNGWYEMKHLNPTDDDSKTNYRKNNMLIGHIVPDWNVTTDSELRNLTKGDDEELRSFCRNATLGNITLKGNSQSKIAFTQTLTIDGSFEVSGDATLTLACYDKELAAQQSKSKPAPDTEEDAQDMRNEEPYTDEYSDLFHLAPNPATEKVQISMMPEACGPEAKEVFVYGLNGGLWYQSQFSYSYGIVPLENLPSGMYLVRVVWEGYSVTKKLIVQ